MNVYDSHKIADVLGPLGYRLTDTPENADMIVLNTCHIREKATEKVFSELGRLKKHKINAEKTGKKPVLAVAGCVAQAEGELITQRADYVDIVIGPQSYHKLPEMVLGATDGLQGRKYIDTDLSTDEKFDHLPEESLPQGPSAFLSIQEGCDKFCTFCVVPYTRGAEYSRPVQDVVEEARRMAGTGTKEITLLGQNVNAYHGQGYDGKSWSLGKLIEEIAKIDDIKRIRYTTSHPRDVDEDLINAHKEIDKLMPFLHLPVQSGSDKILKAMNRKHTAEHYINIIDKLRTARPDLALSSDFIVGFPGETEDDFNQTMSLVREIEYIYAYSFKYSPRPGTPASTMGALVPEDIKSKRLERLQNLLNEQQFNFNKQCVGNKMDTLLEKQNTKHKTQLIGRTPFNQSIHVEAPARLQGQIVEVEITDAGPNSLSGKIVDHEFISVQDGNMKQTA